MRGLALLVLIAVSSIGVSLPQQKPDDGRSIDSIVAALYDTISGPAGKERDWTRFRALLAPDAQLSAVFVRKSGDVIRYPVNVEQYIKASGPMMMDRGFFEKETKRKQDQFGNIAHVFSSYESRETKDGKPFETGVNSIQLWNDGKRWWIQTIMWQGEASK